MPAGVSCPDSNFQIFWPCSCLFVERVQQCEIAKSELSIMNHGWTCSLKSLKVDVATMEKTVDATCSAAKLTFGLTSDDLFFSSAFSKERDK